MGLAVVDQEAGRRAHTKSFDRLPPEAGRQDERIGFGGRRGEESDASPSRDAEILRSLRSLRMTTERSAAAIAGYFVDVRKL